MNQTEALNAYEAKTSRRKNRKKKPAKGSRIGTFDIETDPFAFGRIPRAFCCGFYDGDEYFSWWGEDCIERAIEKMLSFAGIIYAHNGGRFDFHYLLPHLPDSVKIFCIGSRIAKLNIGLTEFRDSFLILPTALKNTGEKLEFDYTTLEADKRDEHRETILTYLEQDCRGLYKTARAFIDRFGLGLTLANRSFAQMEELGLEKDVNSKYYDAELRPYFFGGRVEAMEVGKIERPLTYIDINSAYPAGMMAEHWFGNEYMVLDKLPPRKEWVGPCFVDITCDSEGALPLREKTGEVHFPRGRARFKATGWELLAGLETKTIKNVVVHTCLRPFKTRSFAPFIEKFYAEKLAADKEGDQQKRLFSKLLMNSGYGKFALDPTRFKNHVLTGLGDVPEDYAKDEETGTTNWAFVNHLETEGFTLWEQPTNEAAHVYYNVATAASITGWVRAFLWRSISAVTGAVYCDTDSIICESAGDLHLGDKLGEWSIEAKGDAVWIGGKKLYAFKTDSGKWKTASKGVKLNADQICKVAEGARITWKSDAPNFSLSGGERFIVRTVRNSIMRELDNARPKRTGGFRSFPLTPWGEADLLNTIFDGGGIRSPGKQSRGEYDCYSYLNKGVLRFLRSRKQHASRPDQWCNELGFEHTDEFWIGIERAWEARQKPTFSPDEMTEEDFIAWKKGIEKARLKNGVPFQPVFSSIENDDFSCDENENPF